MFELVFATMVLPVALVSSAFIGLAFLPLILIVCAYVHYLTPKNRNQLD